MWPDLIQKAKDGGLDVIQTYVFWNGHEPTQGKVMCKTQNFTNAVYICVFFMLNYIIHQFLPIPV